MKNIKHKVKYTSLGPKSLWIFTISILFILSSCSSPIDNDPQDTEKTPTEGNLEYRMDEPIRMGLSKATELEFKVKRKELRPGSPPDRHQPMEKVFADFRMEVLSEDRAYIYIDALLRSPFVGNNNPRPQAARGHVGFIKIRYEGEIRTGQFIKLDGDALSRRYITMGLINKDALDGEVTKDDVLILKDSAKSGHIYVKKIKDDKEEIELEVIIDRLLSDSPPPFQIQMEIEAEIDD